VWKNIESLVHTCPLYAKRKSCMVNPHMDNWEFTVKEKNMFLVNTAFEEERHNCLGTAGNLNLKVSSTHCVTWVIKSRMMRRTGHVACMGEMRNAYYILVEKPEGIEDNIKMDLT
jgi:hypothetical protein